MIRCDECPEWYHGNCVNISKQEGQRLDKENIQWICPHCVKKEKRDTKVVMPKSDRDRHHSSKREDKHDGSKSHDSSRSHDRSRDRSHERSHDRSHDSKSHDSKSHDSKSHDSKSHDSSRRRSKEHKKRLKFSKPEPPKQHCLGIKCDNWAKPAAIYCSTRCIVSHCRDSLKLIEQEKEKATGSTTGGKPRRDSFGDALAPESSKPADREPERISVIERHTGRLRTGLAAPTRLQLPIWLERHPTYEVLKPNMKHGYTTSQFYSSKPTHSSSSRDRHDSSKDSKPMGEIREKSKVRRESESKSSDRRDSTSKRERRDSHHEAGTSKKEKSDDGKKDVKTPVKSPATKAAEEVQDSVRMSVKKTLWDVLRTRVKEAENFVFPEHKVKKIAYHVENELFKIFNEANNKYKAKYRSLIFNIKDQKNQGLFRRILKGRISAEELVQMSSEQLASKELSEWREREAKHVLDMMIDEAENREIVPLTKKTHKGEIEIEEDLSMLESNMATPALKVNTSGMMSPVPLTSPINPLAMLQDSTDQHNNHLFDMNCKICTGKMAPPKEITSPVTLNPIKRTFSSSDRQSSTEEEIQRKASKGLEEDEGDKEEGELDEEEEEEHVAMEKPSYSYSEEGEDIRQSPPEYEPPDVSSSPEGHNMQSSYLPRSTSMRIPDVEDDLDDPEEMEEERPMEASEASMDGPISPTMSSPEEEKPSKPTIKRITPPVIWKGIVNMPEVSRFMSNSYHVSGPPHSLATDIPENIEICGRIPYAVVWDYFNSLRKSRTTDLIIVRFHIAQESDKPAYAALFQYFHSRKRIGVVGNKRPHVKDMYLLPLAAQDPVPGQIQPFNGPGLERHRPHTFLGLIVRHKDRARSASMGHMPVSERSALPGGTAHPVQLKRHLSQPETAGNRPLPDWTDPDFEAKRPKQEPSILETPMEDPIVAQYAHADPTELVEEPYSPTREEAEAPYDPSDVMDDIGERRLKDASASKDIEGGTPPLPPNLEQDPSKLNDLLENMGELNANDIAHAASDVTENLLTAFSSKPNLTEQQQLLIKLTKQVEDAKKALLDRQIASLQSEIDKAATEITVAMAPGVPEDNTIPMVTATMVHQLPGTKLPSPRILRAPADSSTNTADQAAMYLPGSPGTPTEEDAHGRSGLGMIQSAYVDPNLETQKTTYTYGNVFTEGGASYPTHPPMPGGEGDGWTGPPLDDKRHPSIDNNNQSLPIPSAAPPNWNNPPFGGPQDAPRQPWDNPEFQPPPDPNLKHDIKQPPFKPEGQFHGRHHDHDDRKRDFNRSGGGDRFPPPDGRPDRPPPRRHSNEGNNRGWEREREREPPPQPPPQWEPQQQLEEGELPENEERGHHRSGPPPDHEPRSGPPPGHEPWRGARGHGPRRGGPRGHDLGQRGGYGGHRRDDQRGHDQRGHGHRGPGDGDKRGWRGNGPDRGGRGKWRGGGRGREQGGRYDYHRY